MQSVRHTLCTREQAWNFPVTVAANAQSLIEIDQLRRETLSLKHPGCESLRLKHALRRRGNSRTTRPTFVFELELRIWWNQPILR
jgi:hypothetical protein